MQSNRPHLINNLFNSIDKKENIILSYIKKRSIALIKLNYMVNTLLPSFLKPWCRVINVRKNIIIIETSNANWKMKLKYEELHLLFNLNKHILPSLTSIIIRINPKFTEEQKFNIKHNNNNKKYIKSIKNTSQYVSSKSAIYIRDIAKHSEGKLKISLERLATIIENKY